MPASLPRPVDVTQLTNDAANGYIDRDPTMLIAKNQCFRAPARIDLPSIGGEDYRVFPKPDAGSGSHRGMRTGHGFGGPCLTLDVVSTKPSERR